MRFAVVGLPRSGTTWAAAWLTDAGALCLHDPLADFSPAELLRLEVSRPWGIACTGAWMLPGLMREIAARCPMIVIERDRFDVGASLAAMGLPAMPGNVFERFERAPGRRVPFGALWDESGAREMWSYLRPDAPFDVHRWRLLRDMRIEPVPARVHGVEVHPGTMQALRDEFSTEGG